MTVGEVVAKLRLDIGKFRSGLSRANALLERNREVAMRASMALAGIGAAIGATMGLAAREAAGFESEMRNVNSILHESEEGFAALSKAVLGLSGKTGKAPQDLARGLYDIASSGFSGAEGLQILEASAKAATAGITDTATAVRAGTAVLNAYGKSASEIGRVQDILFKTVERGVITYEQLALNLGDVIAMAAQAKIPLEEIGAAIAAMTKAGVQPAEAFTSLNRIIQGIIAPTSDAATAAAGLGVELSASALEAKGLSAIMLEVARAAGTGTKELSDLAKSSRTDAEFMDELSASSGTAIEKLKAMFPEIRAFRGAAVLAAEGGQVFSEEILAMADATGATARAFAEQSKSFQVQWAKTWAAARAVLVRFGNDGLPILKAFASLLGIVVRAGEALPPTLRVMIALSALLAAGLFSVAGAVVFYNVYLADAYKLTVQWIKGLARLGTTATVTAAQVQAAGAQMSLFGAGTGARGAQISLFKAEELARMQAAKVAIGAVGAETLTMGAAFRAAGVAVKGFFASLGPIWWTVIAVSTAAMAWGLYRDHMNKAAQAAKEHADKTKEQADRLAELLPKLKAVNDEIERARSDPTTGGIVDTKLLADQVDLLNEIAEVMPQIFTHDRAGNAILREQAALTAQVAESRNQAHDLTRKTSLELVRQRQQERMAALEAMQAQQKLVAQWREEERKARAGESQFGLDEIEKGLAAASAEEHRRAMAYKGAEQSARAAQNAYRQLTALAEQAADSDEKRAAAARRVHAEQMQQYQAEAKALRDKGVDTQTVADYIAQREKYAQMKASAEVKALIADVEEAEGKSYEARLARAAIAYGKEIAEARVAGDKKADLETQAELKLQAELTNISREYEEERLQQTEERLEKNEAAIRDAAARWQAASEGLLKAGVIGTGEHIANLDRILQRLRAIDAAQKAAGRDALFDEEQLRLVETIFSERKRMVDELGDKERDLHRQRIAWMRAEEDERTRVHLEELSAIELQFQREKDIAIVQGRDTDVAQARRAAAELAALEQMREATQLSGEALFRVAERQVDLAKQAAEGGALSRTEAAAAISQSYDDMQRAAEAMSDERRAEFEDRRKDYMEQNAALTKETATLREGLAQIPERILSSLEQAVSSMQRLVSDFGGAGGGGIPQLQAVAASGSSRVTNLYYEGRREAPSPRIQELMDQIAAELDREQGSPRN